MRDRKGRKDGRRKKKNKRKVNSLVVGQRQESISLAVLSNRGLALLLLFSVVCKGLLSGCFLKRCMVLTTDIRVRM